MDWKSNLNGSRRVSKKKPYNLRNADECRDWLKSLRLGANKEKITEVQVDENTKLSIDAASDEQIIKVANGLAVKMAEHYGLKVKDETEAA